MKQSNQHTCPKCAVVIPDEAPGGLCPKCALEGVATVSNSTSGGKKSAPPGIAEIAPHFPELEILELIGFGGMGAVYKARQPQLDRFVALKILSHDLAGDPAFVERFNREARVLARLSHPNIVGIHDFGTAGPYCYLTMELVDGVNLRQAMQAGRYTPTEALAMVQHLCAALKFAHEEGILHRDIKPENILIDSKGRVKIADFGIAKLVGEDRQHDITLTLQGSVLGSPHYMAPEQIETPGDVDQRADIYSLGVVLYEMLTGGLPIGRFALPSQKAEMDARIDHIVMRTLEKERERRYQTVGEMKTEFDGIEGPAAPSQAAFTTDQILEGSKYTFRMAMIFLVLLFINVGPSLSGDTDDPFDASGLVFFLVGAAILLSTVSAVLRVMHTIRTQVDQSGASGPRLVSGHAPIPQGQRTTHLGLTAAILTGVSLLLAGVTLYVANTLRDGDMRMIAIVLGVSLDGTIAPLGFIFGAKVLGEIRKSGGTKDGLGFAIFAVVAWPICLMAALILTSLYAPMPGSGGSGISPALAVLLAGISLLLASYALIRGLRRWARGVEGKDGTRSHPGLGRPILMSLLVAVGVPILTMVGLHLFGGGKEDRWGVSETHRIDWYRGRPEVSFPVRIDSGIRATFRLVQRDGKGGQSITTVGQATTISPDTFTIDVGAYRVPDSEDRLYKELAITVRSSRETLSSFTGSDISGWEFTDDLPDAPVIIGPDRREFQLASRRSADGTQEEVLVFEVETTFQEK